MSVRHYPALDEQEIDMAGERIAVEQTQHRIPLLLVPPLAATSMIFDLMPHRSVVRYFLAKGFDVYLVDWGDVTADHSNLSLDHTLSASANSRSHTFYGRWTFSEQTGEVLQLRTDS